MRVVYECEGCVLDHKCILVGEIKPDMCVLSGTPCNWKPQGTLELLRVNYEIGYGPCVVQEATGGNP
jgi:hypothetical protein